MARCGQATNVWAETVDEDTGEVSLRLAGLLPAGVADVADACDAFGSGVTVTTDDVGRVSRRAAGATVLGICGTTSAGTWACTSAGAVGVALAAGGAAAAEAARRQRVRPAAGCENSKTA